MRTEMQVDRQGIIVSMGNLPDWLNESWNLVLANAPPMGVSRNSCNEVYQQLSRNSCNEVYQQQCHPFQRQLELELMMKEARRIRPKVIYEIGSSRGGGVYHWSSCQPSVEKIIAADINGQPYGPLFEGRFPRIKFHWIPLSSRAPGVVQQVQNFLAGQHIDVLFIDGDKHNFLADFDTYLPLMRKDGIVFMHDIQTGTTAQAFKSICRRGYDHTRILNTAEAVEAKHRERAGIPSKNAYEWWLRHFNGSSGGVGVVYLDQKPRD